MTKRRLTSCDQHHISDLGYLAAHEDAILRIDRGEKMYKCQECGSYKWPRIEGDTE